MAEVQGWERVHRRGARAIRRGRLQVTLIAFVALCGCNDFYGLDATTLRDGPPIDAPPECFLDRVSYGTDAVGVIRTGGFVASYNFDENRTIAVAHRTGIEEGIPDSDTLVPSVFDPPLPAGASVDYPRLAPEGDELFVRIFEPPVDRRIERFTREGSRWTNGRTLSVPIEVNSEPTSPSRRMPGGRRMVIKSNVGLQEYVESDPDTWKPLGDPFDALLSPVQPSLTPDARHLIYATNTTGRKLFRYLSRADISQPFGNPIDFNPFFGNPDIFWPFLTGDCGRLYLIVSSENLFYVKQR